MRNQSSISFRKHSDKNRFKKTPPKWISLLKKVDPMFYIILVVVIIALIVLAPTLSLYELKINDTVIGYIKNPDKVNEFQQEAKTRILKQQDLLSVDEVYEIVSSKTSRANHKATSNEALISSIMDNQKYLTCAYLLKIDKTTYLNAIQQSKIEDVILALKEKLKFSSDEDIAQIQILEKVIIAEQKIPISEIMSPVDFIEKKKNLLDSINPDIAYTVKSGDTISKIAKHHNVTIEWIEKSNPNLDINKISIGQVIMINSLDSFLHRK